MARWAIRCGALTLLLVGSACTPGGPQTPSPSPTAATTPVETQLERQRRLDFEAAEKAYRAARTELDRVLNAGGATRATEAMTETGTGPYLAGMLKLVQSYAATDSHQDGRERIVYLHRGGYSPDSLLLEACSDGTEVETISEGKSLGFNKYYRANIEMRKTKASWRVWERTSKELDSCEA